MFFQKFNTELLLRYMELFICGMLQTYWQTSEIHHFEIKILIIKYGGSNNF